MPLRLIIWKETVCPVNNPQSRLNLPNQNGTIAKAGLVRRANVLEKHSLQINIAR